MDFVCFPWLGEGRLSQFSIFLTNDEFVQNFKGAGISERPWLNLEIAPQAKQMKQHQVVFFKCNHFLHDLFGMTSTWAMRHLPRECSLTPWFGIDLYPRPCMVRILNWCRAIDYFWFITIGNSVFLLIQVEMLSSLLVASGVTLPFGQQ